jgi:hypothetical protein
MNTETPPGGSSAQFNAAAYELVRLYGLLAVGMENRSVWRMRIATTSDLLPHRNLEIGPNKMLTK